MKHLVTALLLMLKVMLIAETPSETAWQVLDGPEKEKGDAVTIQLTQKAMSIKANGKTFAYPFGPDECRISKVDTLAIAHTNTSRGYQTYRVSDLKVAPK